VSFRLALVAALVVAVVGVTAASSMAAPSKLVGTVGPGYTITLTKGGKKVRTLTAGKYTFVITDKSSNHSYGLDGPSGFAKDFTSVSFRGTKTFTLTLKKGKYKYYCAHHESTMYGYFTVT
jgi:plastocyanin